MILAVTLALTQQRLPWAGFRMESSFPKVSTMRNVSHPFDIYLAEDSDYLRGNENPGTIYFLQCSNSGYIKIGWARNTKDRISALQAGNPLPMKLLGTKVGTLSDEKALHRLFSHLRFRGEWFSPDDELIEYIRENTI